MTGNECEEALSEKLNAPDPFEVKFYLLQSFDIL
jgi:hypothetical protein